MKRVVSSIIIGATTAATVLTLSACTGGFDSSHNKEPKVYNSSTADTGFDPAQNEEPCVYGPPQAYDNSSTAETEAKN